MRVPERHRVDEVAAFRVESLDQVALDTGKQDRFRRIGLNPNRGAVSLMRERALQMEEGRPAADGQLAAGGVDNPELARWVCAQLDDIGADPKAPGLRVV